MSRRKETDSEYSFDEDFKELTLDEILINLKILAKIRKDEKLKVIKDTLSIDNRYFQFWNRWWSDDGRDTTISFIHHMVKQAFLVCDTAIDASINQSDYYPFGDDNCTVVQRINRELYNSLDGLTTIKLTYATDSSVQSTIDVLMENIRNKIQSNNELLRLDVN